MTILSLSLVRALALAIEAIGSGDSFTERAIPNDVRTFEEKQMLHLRANASFINRYDEVINSIFVNHGVDADFDREWAMELFDRYYNASKLVTGKRYADAKRKRDDRVNRERELAAERELVAQLLAA